MKREENLQKDIERQQSWAAGWEDAMKKYSEASEKASERGRAAFESVTSNMETAIRRFVDTGKFAFKDFVGSVIKDLLVMEARAQASMILRSIISSFSGMPSGGGGGGSAGSIVGDLFGSVGKKASGGYIDSPTIVGENGAELFVPSRSGTVIPNGSWQQMAAASGGNNGITVNGNYIANMSAIDTQSATQFLAKNKNAIWASYQSANRSVPISR
jgi:phage-related minor tail protein